MCYKISSTGFFTQGVLRSGGSELLSILQSEGFEFLWVLSSLGFCSMGVLQSEGSEFLRVLQSVLHSKGSAV